MFAQLFDSFRKASEASLLAQQDIFRQWIRQWPSAPLNNAGSAGEWSEAVQHRFLEGATEALNKHRELLDATYKSGIQVIDQTFRVSEARSPEDYRRMVEELWRKLSETFKAQSEAQFREFQSATERWIELAKNGAKSAVDEYERKSAYGSDAPSARA
ncbi:MAG TPA: hypothetical protein VG963_04940 [Polyangiaceae bacterium]|nr:hypothetical protein [Polyangiaceae bacterium]